MIYEVDIPDYDIEKLKEVNDKIAEAYLVYSPSKDSTVTANPFAFLAVYNLFSQILCQYKENNSDDIPDGVKVSDEIVSLFEKYGYCVEFLGGQLSDNGHWQFTIKEIGDEIH